MMRSRVRTRPDGVVLVQTKSWVFCRLRWETFLLRAETFIFSRRAARLFSASGCWTAALGGRSGWDLLLIAARLVLLLIAAALSPFALRCSVQKASLGSHNEPLFEPRLAEVIDSSQGGGKVQTWPPRRRGHVPPLSVTLQISSPPFLRRRRTKQAATN